MQTVKYIEDGKVVAEFTDLQKLNDFIVERTKRSCDAEYILSRRKIDSELMQSWFIIGFLCCEIFFLLLSFIL